MNYKKELIKLYGPKGVSMANKLLNRIGKNTPAAWECIYRRLRRGK